MSKRVMLLTTCGVRNFAAKAQYGNNLVFLGAPGVGKGTFANRIAPKLGVPSISTGDIIRAEIKKDSPLGKKVKEYANSGKLVPDEIVSEMVRLRLKEPDAQNGWILVSLSLSLVSAEWSFRITPHLLDLPGDQARASACACLC